MGALQTSGVKMVYIVHVVLPWHVQHDRRTPGYGNRLGRPRSPKPYRHGGSIYSCAGVNRTCDKPAYEHSQHHFKKKRLLRSSFRNSVGTGSTSSPARELDKLIRKGRLLRLRPH